MKCHLNIFLYLCIFLSIDLVAQDSASNFLTDTEFLQLPLKWQNIGGERNTWFLKKDDRGFIWFNSKRGLARFDGVNYKYYSHNLNEQDGIISGHVRIVEFDEDPNVIWLGYEANGLYKFNVKTGKATAYQYGSDDNQKLADYRISELFKDRQNRIWVITRNHTLHLLDKSTDTFIRFEIPVPDKYKDEPREPLPGRMIQDVLDPDVLWIASRLGLFKFNIGSRIFQHYDIDNYVRSFNFQFPTPIYQDPEGLIWFGHFRNEGVKVFDTTKEAWIHQIRTEQIESSLVFDIVPYGDSLVLASLRPGHLLVINRFDPSKNWVHEYEGETNSSTLLVDSQLNLYTTSGLSSFAKVTRKDNLIGMNTLKGDDQENPIWPFCFYFDSSKEQYFIGDRFNKGLVICNDAFQIIKSVPFNKDEQGSIGAIYRNEDIIWLATSKGIFIYDLGDKKQSTLKRVYQYNEEGWGFQKIKTGGNKIWFVARDQILYYDLNKNIFETIDFKDAFDSLVDLNDVQYFDREKIFIGTNQGLYLYDFKENKFVSFNLDNYSDEVQNKFKIQKIVMENDTIWLGSLFNGLIKLITQEGHEFLCQNYFNAFAPESNNIMDVKLLEDYVWLSGRNGFQIFNRSKEDFLVYDSKDGIPRSWRRPVFFQGKEENLLMPFNESFFDLNPKFFAPVKMVAFLNECRVNNEIVDFDSKLNHDQVINLKPDQRDISFEFGALNFGTQDANFFRYRLIGVDDEWTFLGEKDFIHFLNLQPGDYILEFDVRSLNSYWNEEVRKISFSIDSPFYKTYWFLLLVTLFLLGALILLSGYWVKMKNNEKYLLQLQKEKAEAELVSFKAQMNPHFIFNTLNSINWYILKNKPKESSKYLTKFSRIMRQILDNSRENLISLKRELSTLSLFVELERMRFENKFDYVVEILDDLDTSAVMVPPLIFQPFVENAIWHGLLNKEGKGLISITISKSSDQLLCIIEDNGVGDKKEHDVDTLSIKESKGIDITKMRIVTLQNSIAKPIEIRYLKDEENNSLGTRVTIQIPFLKM